MENKFTPGPLRALETRIYLPNNQGGFNICGSPNAEVNAHLIAAAPEMYDVLDKIVKYFVEPGGKEDWVMFSREMLEPAKHVLAKARGE